MSGVQKTTFVKIYIKKASRVGQPRAHDVGALQDKLDRSFVHAHLLQDEWI